MIISDSHEFYLFKNYNIFGNSCNLVELAYEDDRFQLEEICCEKYFKCHITTGASANP